MATPASPLLSVDDFAAKIKAKYPDYANMDNTDLANRIVSKYPEYKSQVDFSQSSQPNAGLADVARPDNTMQTSGLGTAYRAAANTARFAKGAGTEAVKQTFGGGNLGEGGQLQPPAQEQPPQGILQSLSDAANQSSLRNVIPNITSGVADTGKAIAQRASTPEGAGATFADLVGMFRGGKKVAQEVLPSTQRAGQAFNQVKAAAGDIPIDMTAPGNTALEIQRLSQSGGMMPKVVRDFIRRATDPDKGPMTYSEARDFYSNASRLSADEAQRLTPNMKRMAGQFRADLGNSLQGAADQAGQGTAYAGAMKEYAQAMRMQDFVDMLKGSAVNAVKYGIPTAVGGTAAGYVMKKALNAK